jgi:hypothetical protein
MGRQRKDRIVENKGGNRVDRRAEKKEKNFGGK